MLSLACGARLRGWTCISGRSSKPNTGPYSNQTIFAKLTVAFKAALTKLRLVDRKPPLITTVAKLIIQLAKDGEREPNELCDRALKILGK
jgi:hypothetical protein